MMWLALLRRFWPYLAGAALLIGAALWFRGQLSDAYDEGFSAAVMKFEEQLLVSAEKGREAVDQARADEKKKYDDERRQQQAREQQAREQDEQRVKDAEHIAAQWRQRYLRAVASEQACTAWAAEPVQCPYQ